MVPDRDGPYPVVVLIHGGFWREAYLRDEMAQLVPDLVARGYAVANLEYRRVGGAGGYPETLVDVAAGLDHLAGLADVRLDLDRVAVVGHSAGGHLASWVAVRDRLPTGVVGAAPAVRPRAVVSLAGVNDLTRAARDDLGGGATQDLLGGGPDDVPDRYDVADPVRSLPPAVPLLAVHGRDDDTVPLDQSERFVADVRAAGGVADLVVLPGDHFVVVDPTSEHWERTVAWIDRYCGA